MHIVYCLQECTAALEEDMEQTFARAERAKERDESRDKTCGICMDVVVEKEDPTERRFGLMSGCSHVYCLSCIRQWRQSELFEKNVKRFVLCCPHG
jgi:E3 ubiquitin-protein ligase makorin